MNVLKKPQEKIIYSNYLIATCLRHLTTFSTTGKPATDNAINTAEVKL